MTGPDAAGPGVLAQYDTGGTRARIETALRAAGKDLTALQPSDFAAFEDFHSLGRIATIGLLEAARVSATDRVLDAGAGIGGTARLLAAEHGCHVTAVDVTPDYCATARWLNELVGLTDMIDVVEGDITALPMPDASVDLIVTQHVQMNIADKAALYRELRRVLRPGGRLALWDVTAGPNQPIHFPVPWADSPERSHLITPDQLRAALTDAGFTVDTFNDLTEFAVTAMTPVFAAPPDPLGLQLLVPDIQTKGQTILTNAREDRLRLIQAVATATQNRHHPHDTHIIGGTMTHPAQRVTTEGASSLFVAGATGATGSHVTRLLLERGHHVRAFVHRADERSEDLARVGADVVVGDLHDLDAVTAALHGTQAGYFVYPIAPGLIEATAVFAQAAHEAGLGAIVNMSQISARRDAKSHAAQQHWIAERLLDRGTVPVTHLRPTFFAENLLLTAGDVIEHAAIRMPLGHGRHAPITVEDQAHVIAAILADPRPHAGATYPLHGPVEMDLFEIARVFSTVLDRPVGYEPTDYDTFADMLTAVGFSAHLIQHLRHVSQDFQRGVFAGTNDVVARIGHKQPVTVAAFVDQHRGIFTPVPIPSGHPS